MKYHRHFRERGFHTALLTTYSFDPVAFQNIMLTTLAGYGSRNIGILCDTAMFNQAVLDIGVPSLAGRSYHVAKRSMPAGAFHPKIVLQLGRTEGKLLIGSANLTTAGISGNLEAVSVVRYNEESSATAGIFKEIFGYFTHHCDPTDEAMRGVLKRAEKQTPWLRDASSEAVVEIADGQLLGFLTEGAPTYADQFARLIEGDKIKRLVIVSPFVDQKLTGIAKLRGLIGAQKVALIPDFLEQDFSRETAKGASWLDIFSPEPLGIDRTRRLHAKVIVAEGETADYVLTGSSNASLPGLFGRGDEFGNAEAALFRTFPAGSAVSAMQVNLSECLDTPFPADKFKLRRATSIGVSDDRKPVDGGSVEMRQGVMRWRPPSLDFVASEVRFHSSNGQTVGEVSAENIRNSWFPIPDEWKGNLKAFRYATVLIAPGSVSVPMPIAFLEEISKNSRPPQSRGLANVLEDIEGAQGIEELYEKVAALSVLNFTEMEEADKKKRFRGGPVEPKEKGQNKDEILGGDSEEFFAVAAEDVDDEGNGPDRAAILEGIRLQLNCSTGAMLFRAQEAAAELAALDQDISSEEEKNEMNANDLLSSEDDNANQNDHGDTENGNEPGKSSKKVLKSRVQQRNALAPFVDDLVKREADLRSVITLRGTSVEMPLDHCILFELVVQMILRTAALGPSEEATADFPFPPRSKENHRGWVVLLAKCVRSHAAYWGNRDLLASDLEDHQISALATLAATIQVLIPAMTSYKFDKKLVIERVSTPAIRFQKCLETSMTTGSPTDILFQQMLSALEEHQVFKRIAEAGNSLIN
ncbi:hypothetical protein [Gymnodinialimonas sp. 57CJ19]|uniref:hypothetical protein n=1 Tax=Gymnodinialimonas sp. 57CJ19 TaxID=3138498 RepID=UPI0031342557